MNVPQYAQVLRASSALLFVLALWQVIVSIWHIPTYLLPSPVDVYSALAADPRYFARHTLTTALEAVVGLILALVFALSTAAMLATFPAVRVTTMPWIVGLQAVPIVAMAPIVVLWLGPNFASKAVMAAILCWFPTVVAATRGLLETDPNHEAIFDVYRARATDRLTKLMLPSGISHVVSGVRVSSGLAMIGAIVAEYVGADRGLGYVITQATYRLDTDRLFAAVICGALAGIFIAHLVYNAASHALEPYLRR